MTDYEKSAQRFKGKFLKPDKPAKKLNVKDVELPTIAMKYGLGGNISTRKGAYGDR